MSRKAESRYAKATGAGACYIVAEAGSNHNRHWEIAARLIDVAAEAGADAVKFQLFRADRLYPPDAGQAEYLRDEADIYDMVASLELPEEWLPRLRERCADRGLDFLVTAFDEASVDAIDPFVPVHKIASYELTHEPLIEHVARKNKPVFISTGGGTNTEIESALTAARNGGAKELVVLQCTAAYPARPEALNVSSLVELRSRFGVPVGFSDHSSDPVVAPVLAVGFGAAVIEKHFTLDRDLPGPDHRFALEPEPFGQMVRAIREAELAVGDGQKQVHSDEEELRCFARRTIFSTRDVRAGERLGPESIAVLRRGRHRDGLPPSEFPALLGRRASRDIDAHTPITAADVEP